MSNESLYPAQVAFLDSQVRLRLVLRAEASIEVVAVGYASASRAVPGRTAIQDIECLVAVHTNDG